MEDHQGDFKSIKVIQFNNRKEDWTEFDLKLKAIADKRGYDEIRKVQGMYPEILTQLVVQKMLKSRQKTKEVAEISSLQPKIHL